MSQPQIVIVGGGIAGLSAGYRLAQVRKNNRQDFEIVLLEASDRWGGKITTIRQDGFVIEGGPDTFLASKPWGVGLCRELGLESELQGTNPDHKSTYVLNCADLKPLPDGLTMMIPTSFGPMIRTELLSWPQKARMGLDFILPPQPLNDDESLGNFVSRRLGRPAYEALIEPLMSGIYAGDGDRLSLKATFPYLRDLELKHGGLVKGALATRRKMKRSGQKAPGTRSAFLTPRTGLAAIIEALVAELTTFDVSMCLSSPVDRITNGQHAGNSPDSEKRFRVVLDGGEVWDADGVILAAPAPRSGSILSDLAPELASELAGIEYASTATVSLAFRQADLPRPLDGYGYIIPRREGRKALACTWTSTKFPHRAPQGYALLRVFIGRAGQDADLPAAETELIQIAREELKLTMQIEAEPVLAKAFFWPEAMPQYNMGHPERLRHIDQRLAGLTGICLAGAGYRGIGIPDCIHSGELAADQLLESLPELVRQPTNPLDWQPESYPQEIHNNPYEHSKIDRPF